MTMYLSGFFQLFEGNESSKMYILPGVHMEPDGFIPAPDIDFADLVLVNKDEEDEKQRWKDSWFCDFFDWKVNGVTYPVFLEVGRGPKPTTKPIGFGSRQPQDGYTDDSK